MWLYKTVVGSFTAGFTRHNSDHLRKFSPLILIGPTILPLNSHWTPHSSHSISALLSLGALGTISTTKKLVRRYALFMPIECVPFCVSLGVISTYNVSLGGLKNGTHFHSY